MKGQLGGGGLCICIFGWCRGRGVGAYTYLRTRFKTKMRSVKGVGEVQDGVGEVGRMGGGAGI